MRRIAFLGAAMAAGATATLAGCTTPHPFVVSADEKSVDIGYSGDPAAALPVARNHCAAYQRVPRLAYTGDSIAYFDCVPASP